MWILMMIVFSQPYQVDHIRLLGEFKQKTECAFEQKRAVNDYNTTGTDKVSFGCIKIKGMKTSLPFAESVPRETLIKRRPHV